MDAIAECASGECGGMDRTKASTFGLNGKLIGGSVFMSGTAGCSGGSGVCFETTGVALDGDGVAVVSIVVSKSAETNENGDASEGDATAVIYTRFDVLMSFYEFAFPTDLFTDT